MFGYIVCYTTSRCDLHNLIIIFFFCVMVVYFLISMTRQLYDHTRCMLTPGLNKDFFVIFFRMGKFNLYRCGEGFASGRSCGRLYVEI